MRRKQIGDEVPTNGTVPIAINVETPSNIVTPAPVIPSTRLNTRAVSPTPSDTIYVSEDSSDSSDVMVSILFYYIY